MVFIADLSLRRIWRWMEEQIPKRTHRIGYVEAYEVSEDELESLAKGGSAGQDYFNLMSIALTGGLTAAVTLLTVPIPEATAWKRELFIVLSVFGLGAGFFLGALWLRAKRKQAPLLQRIRARALGPLGEEGKELKPAELERLPQEEPQRK